MRIDLVPLGAGVDLELLDDVSATLAQTFACSCHVHSHPLDIDFAHDLRRNQYHSTAILRHLAEARWPKGDRQLGVTAADLFVPVLTFVFGEAQVAGTCAVVSYHRLCEEFYGLPPRQSLVLERLVKEAVHELGHTFGLRHCSDWQCVMASSHAVERLDVKTAHFCRRCHAVIKQGGGRSRPSPVHHP